MAGETIVFETIFQNMNLGYVTWIIPLVALIMLSFMISRNLNDIKVILFPLAVMLQATGMNMGIIVLVGTGFLFAVETFSFELISNTISSITRTVASTSSLATDIVLQRRKKIEKTKEEEKKNIISQLFNPKTGKIIGKPEKGEFKSLEDLSKITLKDMGIKVEELPMRTKEKGFRKMPFGEIKKPFIKLRVPDRQIFEDTISITAKQQHQKYKKRSFDKWWKEGSIKKETNMGKQLKERIGQVENHLKRKLKRSEIKELYEQIGNENR